MKNWMDLIESDVKVFEFDMKMVGWILNILVLLKLWYLMRKKKKTMLNHNLKTLKPKSQTLNPKPQTRNPKPQTLNLKP